MTTNPKHLTGNQVRQMFLDYFHSKGHMIEPGASLVPHNDPTLLWINAGVAALKKYFDGTETPKCNRICNAQKSIRTNDIENVGKTARHHTFFEMLGNFSIGDYFKKEAIPFAWEFLTSPDWIGFDKNRLYITVYPDDTEAYDLWTKTCGVDPSHIRKTEDNFWEIGEGPGGPDTEIFYDRGEKYDPEHLGEKLFFDDLENDRYIEVWNVVFSQYDCKPGEMPRSQYKELPHKNIDTGMGLERLVALIQDGETNFDTDLFMPIIEATGKLAKVPYEGANKMAYRVIADHIRTVTFALADGATFSNEGRGYVLRRVLRRAVRYGIALGIEGSFMYHLVQVVADSNKDFYPYLEEKVDLISRLVQTEEETFQATLVKGEKLLKESLKEATNHTLDGKVVFKLYDTYGFPKELTQEIAQDAGYTVDMKGFDQHMAEQKERARASRSEEQSMASQSKDLMDFKEESTFTGYTTLVSEGKVIGLFKDGVFQQSLDDYGDVILDTTSFYAESGGQVGDQGLLTGKDFEAMVTDCKKAPNGQHLMHIEHLQGMVSLGQTLQATVDANKRAATRANHSSLHLLDSALRKIVGTHVAQAGSFVNSEYGRFDFTHYEKLTSEQIGALEEEVNTNIMKDLPVTTEVLPIEEAKKTGAIALFDEKYGDTVRVVSMGQVSKEFCGGTHVGNTGEMGVFRIVSEESIGSGTRRITCTTKMAAYHQLKEKETTLKTLATSLKLNSPDLVEARVQELAMENTELKRTLTQLNEKMTALKASEEAASAVTKKGLSCLIKKVDNQKGDLKAYAEALRNKLTDGFVFLANVSEGKIAFACACSPKANELGLEAGALVKEAAALCGGNGGGRKDIAMAGGKEVTKVDEALQAIEKHLG